MEKGFANFEQVGYFIKGQKLRFLKDSFGLKMLENKKKKECCSCPINLVRSFFVTKTRLLIKHKKSIIKKKFDLCHQVSKQYFQDLWTL